MTVAEQEKNERWVGKKERSSGRLTKEILFQALVNLYKEMGGGRVLGADSLRGRTRDSKISIEGSEGMHAN